MYLQAIKLFPDLPLAYQGVTKLYTEKEQWEKLGQLLKTQVIRAVKEYVHFAGVHAPGLMWEW